MKKCNKCNKELSLDQFNQRQAHCKPCQHKYVKAHYRANADRYKEINVKTALKHYHNNKEYYAQKLKEYYNKGKDGLHYVYYIPEHHYIGVTSSLRNRKYSHKNAYGRIIDGIEIVYKTPSRSEAELVESTLHSMGYCG